MYSDLKIINNAVNDHNDEFWWSFNMSTKTLVFSNTLFEICGIDPNKFESKDFLLIVNPKHRNRIHNSLHGLILTGTYNEKFQLLTKYGYRWIFSHVNKIIINDKGENVVFGNADFLTDIDVIVEQNKEVQSHLHELINRYATVSKLLMELLNSSDIHDVIIKILNNLIEEFNGDRIYIFEYDSEKQTQSCVYEVVSGDVKVERDRLQNMPVSSVKWWTEMLIDKEMPIILDDIEEIADKAEYKLMKSQNITSIMVVPLMTTNGVGGYIGIDMVDKKHILNDTDKQWFISISNIMSLCIELKKSEDLAKLEREHTLKLYENMPMGLVRLKLIYDKNGNPIDYLHLEINPLAYKFSETEHKDIIGKLGSEFYPIVSRKRLLLFDDILKAKRVYKGRVASKVDNNYFDYLIYPAENDELILLIQDNTEPVRATRALHKSEETLRNIYKNIPIGIEIYDKDGTLISLNDMEKEIFGFDAKEDVLGVNLFQNPNVPKSFLDDLRNHKLAWCDFYYDFNKLNSYYKSENRGTKHIVLKGTALYDTEDNVENYLLIILDNTDFLRANNKVHEFEVLFNSISEFAYVGLCQWSPCEKKIVGTDQWFYNLGQEKHDLETIEDAYTNVYEEDVVKLRRGFENIMAGKILSFREDVRIRDNGGLRWLRSHYKILDYYPNENKIEIIGINIDITELKNTELKLTEAKIKAEESDRLKSAFLANMSHEIRTPLNAIVGFSDLLIDTEDVVERQEYMSIIRQNNELLLQLISGILDISKIESGIVDVNLCSVDVNELCREVVCSQLMKGNKDLKIVFETQHDDCYIVSDKNRLMQVFTNLIGNAVKFTKQGGVFIGYELRNNEIEFYVRDTGIGISNEQLSNVFTRFIKLNSFVPGTGLGLPICQSIIEKLGGKIWVVSEFGHGACFRFSLPYNNIDHSGDAINENAASALTGNNEKISNIEKPVILVAEDTDSNYILVSTVLKRNYTLLRAKTGVEAVDLFKKHNPDLVLMDIKMPEMGGIEAIAKIKAISKDIPIVVLTAFAYDNDRKIAMEAGACDYMTKPIHRDKLIAIVEKYIQ
ncbi:MAG: ATP-binding protein [Rikenellaceae bacterium]